MSIKTWIKSVYLIELHNALVKKYNKEKADYFTGIYALLYFNKHNISEIAELYGIKYHKVYYIINMCRKLRREVTGAKI